MRAKSLILLVVALGCGMIAAVAVSKTVLERSPEKAVDNSVEIFVAVKDLAAGQHITADAVKLEKWPSDRLPVGALVNLEQVEGKCANQMIFANEPILERKISDEIESLATIVRPGYRVFDIACSASYIKPGDHVDIVGVFRSREGHHETKTVMRNVQVIGINGVTTRDSEAKAAGNSTFQLLIKERQLEALTLANNMGTLTLNLRPFSEESNQDDNGGAFLSWVQARDQKEPAKAKSETQAFASTSVKDNSSEKMAAAMQALATSDAQAAKPKHEMMIITPAGIKKYQWSDNDEMPQEVEEVASNSNPFGAPPTGANPWQTYGNVPSGYGGYTPTYPTSTNAPGLGAASETDAPPPTGGEPTPLN